MRWTIRHELLARAKRCGCLADTHQEPADKRIKRRGEKTFGAETSRPCEPLQLSQVVAVSPTRATAVRHSHKHMNSVGGNEATALSQRGTKRPRLSTEGTVFFSSFLFFFSFSFLSVQHWMILSAHLGIEVGAALDLKEGAREQQQGTELKDSVKERTRTAAATVTNRWSRRPSGRWGETGQEN